MRKIQGLGPREDRVVLQGEPARQERTSVRVVFTRRHGVSVVLEGGDSSGGNRQGEPSLRGRGPCRTSASFRRAPAFSKLVCGRLASVSCPRKWSLARATAERSVGRNVAEDMAPRSGADHARNELVGSDENSGSRDRTRTEVATSRGGGSRARTGVPVRLSIRQKSVKSGFGPHDVCPSGVLAALLGIAGRDSALAGTPRALPSGRARASVGEGKSSMFEEA